MREQLEKEGIAIRGMGAVTPYGSGVPLLWQALIDGQSAISAMDLFDTGGIACVRAGVVRNHTAPAASAGMGRASSFAISACLEALTEAGWAGSPTELAETALITASNFGDIDVGEAALIPPDNPAYNKYAAAACTHVAPGAAIAKALGLGGVVIPLSLSCASGASAVATAANLINAGHIKRALIVGYDAISRFSWSGLCALRTMSKTAVRPFDSQRDGTIFTEGAAALALELAATTTQPIAWLRGWASGNNGHHMTAPAMRGAGSLQVMAAALTCADLLPAAIEHINMHGTGTRPNDSTETHAVQDLLGAHATAVPVTSIKGLLGHMLGAAGTVELIVAALSLRHGLIPPTGNLTVQDPECNLDVVTTPRRVVLDCVLSNSAGFGGCNAAAVITRTPPTGRTRTRHRPVLIRAAAAISALGADLTECAAAFAEGEPALFDLTLLTLPQGCGAPLVGEAPDVTLTACGVTPKAYLDRASHYFLAACGMALTEAGLTRDAIERLNAGILCGTTWGCAASAESFFADYIQKGARLVKPFLFPHAYSNTAVSLAAIEWGLKGQHENVAGTATAAGVALVEAVELLRAGRAEILLAGGVDVLSRTRLTACAATAAEPQGEAAAAVVLACATESATAPMGRIIGCALAVTPEAAAQQALLDAELAPDSLCAIYANGSAIHCAHSLCHAKGRVINPETLSGAVAGATTALHLALALRAGHAAPFMVLTSDNSCATALVVATT